MAAPTPMETGNEECPTCKDKKAYPICQNTFTISSKDFILAATGGHENLPKSQRRNLKKEKIEQFLKNINALLNTGFGMLFIHVEPPQRLGFLDEAVDNKLLEMIPDDSLFHENFERFFFDEKHVVFQVIQRYRPISTFSFNTKVSTDVGLVDPTHGQMRHFLSGKVRQTAEGAKRKELYIFKKDQEVQIEVNENGKKTRVAFQENMTTQAKRFKPELLSGSHLVQGLVKVCSDTLPGYISAFCKQPKGGSVYFGVYEDKDEKKKWTEQNREGIDELLSSLDMSSSKLYKDNNEDDLYHIAPQGYMVPTDTQKKTGQFKPSGAVLTNAEQNLLKDEIITSVKSKMKWVSTASFDGSGANMRPPLSVRFHPVEEGGPREVVVEVCTDRYEGIIFSHPDGPLAYDYTPTEDGSGEPVRIDTDVWIERNIEFAKKH